MHRRDALRGEPQRWVVPMHPGDRTYRNQLVRISDLAVTEDVISDVVFENCILDGPAVLLFLGEISLVGNTLIGNLDSILWTIQPGRDQVVGAIGMLNVQLVQCRLQRLGIAVLEQEMDEMRRMLSGD